MFDLRSYSYDEMCKAFKTDRNDCIKKKLTTLGYTFTTSGRGKKIQFKIVAYNKPELYDFKQFCIEELGYDVRTDFKKLYVEYLYKKPKQTQYHATTKKPYHRLQGYQ